MLVLLADKFWVPKVLRGKALGKLGALVIQEWFIIPSIEIRCFGSSTKTFLMRSSASLSNSKLSGNV
jgi:hypothetical protein